MVGERRSEGYCGLNILRLNFSLKIISRAADKAMIPPKIRNDIISTLDAIFSVPTNEIEIFLTSFMLRFSPHIYSYLHLIFI